MRPRSLFQPALLVGLAVLVALGATALALREQGPSGSIEILLPSPTAQAGTVVHVTGAVATPGLVYLAEGDRVGDAVARAGGLGPDADATRINLAARVADGDHVHVPRIGEAVVAPAPQPGSAGRGSLINLNTATAAELEALPGIGTVRAESIIDQREANGGFERVEDLLLVPGIGQVTLERLRPLVTVR